jgi:hypothetical protein
VSKNNHSNGNIYLRIMFLHRNRRKNKINPLHYSHFSGNKWRLISNHNWTLITRIHQLKAPPFNRVPETLHKTKLKIWAYTNQHYHTHNQTISMSLLNLNRRKSNEIFLVIEEPKPQILIRGVEIWRTSRSVSKRMKAGMLIRNLRRLKSLLMMRSIEG